MVNRCPRMLSNMETRTRINSDKGWLMSFREKRLLDVLERACDANPFKPRVRFRSTLFDY